MIKFSIMITNGYGITFTRRFSMAHRLISGASPKCAVPHGHNEFLAVSIVSKKDDFSLDCRVNMLESFDNIKKKWHQFIDNRIDHALQLSHSDPLIEYFKQNEPEKLDKIVITLGDPTTEMMCACLMAKFQTFLDHENSHLVCNSIVIEETPTNKVNLNGTYAFKTHLPKETEQLTVNPWWYRNDLTIN